MRCLVIVVGGLVAVGLGALRSSSAQDAGAVNAAAPGARSAQLRVRLLEHGSRRPLPEVGLRAWIYRPNGRTTVEQMTVDADGRATLEAEALLGAKFLSFAIRDPQLGSVRAIRPDGSIDELLRSREPYVILVPRGAWRHFRVIDADGAPIGSATLEDHALRPATTGTDGEGRVRMTVPPPKSVDVSAPGYRVEHVAVPPANEAWIVQLRRANRVEFALVGTDDVRGYHVTMRLPATMQQRTFYQTNYVQTPGRPRDGTSGRWTSEGHRGPSRWSLGVPASGLAVVDQIYDGGTVDVELWRFGKLLATRSIELSADGRTVRVDFVVAPPPPEFVGRVVDANDRPVAGVRIGTAPRGGRATIGLARDYPVWAPRTATAAAGDYRIADPQDDATVVVFSKQGFADRALSIAELRAHDFRVQLEPGRTVVVEVRDRNGNPIDGGWSTGDAYLHARPSVHLGHDVWRDVSPRDHPALGESVPRIPYFVFADLPKGVVKFRFTYLPVDEVLVHDTNVPTARFVSRTVLAELGIGK